MLSRYWVSRKRKMNLGSIDPYCMERISSTPKRLQMSLGEDSNDQMMILLEKEGSTNLRRNLKKSIVG